MTPSFDSSSRPSANSRHLSTIPNVHKNTTMAPRRGTFSCGHNSSALPAVQHPCYELLGHDYYTHLCKTCMGEENHGREVDIRRSYHAERLRLFRAIRTVKRLLAETQSNSTTNREAREIELRSSEEELRKLDAEAEETAAKAVWRTYNWLWPTVHASPGGG